MLQAQFMFFCNVVEIQEPRLGPPLFQKLFAGLSGRVGHVYEDCVPVDVQRAHEERCDILRGERPSRGGYSRMTGQQTEEDSGGKH